MKSLLTLALLLGTSAAQTSPPPGAPSPAPTPAIDPSIIDPALRKYLVEPPHVTCITQDYNGPLQTARYINRCSDPYRITIVFVNIDDPKQLDIAAGKVQNTVFTKMDYATRQGSSWYICPKGYSAVDARGQYFKRPVSIYLCRQLAS
ncbi:hypothetical protein [Granulicella sp. dw_53]|uniref:hypothetical protein n=1 Tax=Granulicella sp. dw_53 TaxID=2719792 RepID=UPI001BD323B7|nr:hypothetical protein [Granulicella sp. dw_53]